MKSRWAIERYWRKLYRDSRGSISVLVFGLFAVLLSTALLLSDISTIYLAKRALIQATEAAAQRGASNLDMQSYYSGEYNALQLAENLFGNSEEDSGIPIDCNAGLRDAREVLSSWSGDSSRANLESIKLDDFHCDGFQIFLQVSAVARIPIPLPFIHIDEVPISTSAGAIGERAETNNYYGLDIG